MRKILIISSWLLVFFLIFIKPTFAQGTCDPGTYCSNCYFDTSPGGLVEGEFDKIIFSFKPQATRSDYIIQSDGLPVPGGPAGRFRSAPISPDANGVVKVTITKDQTPRLFLSCETLAKKAAACTHDKHFLSILRPGVAGEKEYCPPYFFDVATPTPPPAACELTVWADDGEFTNNSQIVVEGKNMPGDSSLLHSYEAAVFNATDTHHIRPVQAVSINIRGGFFRAVLGRFGDGNYETVIIQDGLSEISCRGGEFSICPSGCGPPTPAPIPKCPLHCQDLIDAGLTNVACGIKECRENCTECGALIPVKPPKVYKICQIIKKPDQQSACITCIRDKKGMWTALGCLPLDIKGFIEYLLRWGSSIAGGIALLLIIYGGFKILTSAGNPEGIAAGKEIITAAIAGLLMIIFAILILRIIGVDILKIPSFLPPYK